MTGSRTIRVLVALIVAMTIGAFTLRLLETKPKISITDLMAVTPDSESRSVLATEAPLQNGLWRNIVIHSSAGDRADIASRVHFIVEDNGTEQLVRPTRLWTKQLTGKHVSSVLRNYNADSIGICIRGDFSRSKPSARKFDALVSLVRMLQQTCNINAEHVYPYSDLSGNLSSPGRSFPFESFSQQLIRKAD